MRIPTSTYRLQLHGGFPLDRAADLVDYLAALGITDLYSSPLLMARPGSEHGYDVTDPTRLNPELGTEADMERLATSLRERQMGWIADTVPNHLCLTSDTNRWWQDVLSRGRDSRYARFFDIYWEPTGPNGRYQVTLPLLGRSLDEVIEQGEIRVVFEDDRLALRYFEHKLPLDPRSLPSEVADLGARTPAVRRQLLTGMNTPQSLRSLISQQAYRPVYWKRTKERVGYRRFFDINELIGVRVEDPAVFAETHALLLEWIGRGWITGLRIDHIDGLRLPKAYLDRLQAACLAMQSEGAGRFFVIVEKILGYGEDLPEDWATAGTTGYEFAAATTRLFIEPEGEARIRAAFARLDAAEGTPDAVERQSRRLVLQRSLHGSVQRLAERAVALAPAFGLEGVTTEAVARAITEIITAFSVYRTYVDESDRELSKADRETLARATNAARAELEPDEAFELVDRLLHLASPSGHEASARDFVLRFQQLSGPAAAKGFEDTTLYRYVPLVCENEVGADLEHPTEPIDGFHSFNALRQRNTPCALNATSTHDTKRSEDARLRIAVLSEIADRWLGTFETFRELNARHRTRNDTIGEGPDPPDEYVFYQNLIGILPDREEALDWSDLASRMSQYMQKAVREAKRRSSWWEPNEAYESAVDDFVRAVLDPARSQAFVTELMEFARPVIRATRYSALSQVLLKIASPGIPDFYQGCEALSFTLVDPDNRRPIDFDRHRALFREIEQRHSSDPVALCRECLDEGDVAKMLVTTLGLSARREHASLFSGGEYVPLQSHGPGSRQILAFARTEEQATAIAIASRFFAAFADDGRPPIGAVWRHTTISASAESIPPGRYRDAFTNQTVEARREGELVTLSVQQGLAHFPVALLFHDS